MTQGILLFAFNNESVNYVEMAVYAANRAKKYLNKPVSIVTSNKQWVLENFSNEIFDHVIEFEPTSKQTKRFYDGTNDFSKLNWNNSNRANCFKLSPYDETLVIDTDYLISSSFLSYCWEQPDNFLIYNDSNDLSGWRPTQEFNFISEFSIPFYWATVFFFRKDNQTNAFFELVEHIEDNWSYYVLLYRLQSQRYRNDFAFSIAIHMMNGFTINDFAKPIANRLHYVLDRDVLLEADDSKLKFLIQKNTTSVEYSPLKTENLDVHVMNKLSLLRVIRGEVNG